MILFLDIFKIYLEPSFVQKKKKKLKIWPNKMKTLHCIKFLQWSSIRKQFYIYLKDNDLQISVKIDRSEVDLDLFTRDRRSGHLGGRGVSPVGVFTLAMFGQGVSTWGGGGVFPGPGGCLAMVHVKINHKKDCRQRLNIQKQKKYSTIHYIV